MVGVFCLAFGGNEPNHRCGLSTLRKQERTEETALILRKYRIKSTCDGTSNPSTGCPPAGNFLSHHQAMDLQRQGQERKNARRPLSHSGGRTRSLPPQSQTS